MTDPPLTLKGWLRYDIVARRLAALEDVRSVLEVGAGEGALGVRLARRYRYVGIEPDELARATARRRFERAGLDGVVNGDLGELADGSAFDLVCAFEVLEHCEDDAAALWDWVDRLRPEGWVMLSVPAFARRFGASDRKAGHYRRYERGQLASLLAAAGLEPRSIDLYGYPFGNLLEAAWNVGARLRPGEGSSAARTAASGRYLQPPEQLGWLTRAISTPGRIAQRAFAGTERGTGFVAVARRGETRPAHGAHAALSRRWSGSTQRRYDSRRREVEL
jgi:SAM-dependent methyltransferase